MGVGTKAPNPRGPPCVAGAVVTQPKRIHRFTINNEFKPLNFCYAASSCKSVAKPKFL